MFADDNVMIHRAYAKDLFTRMIPLRKHWIGQCSLAAVRRLENVQLMAASGCKALFVGFESIDEETTRYTGKKQNRPSEYKETVHMLREHGISVWGSFVFGFDTDDPEVFDRTVEFAHRDAAHDGELLHAVSLPGDRALPPARGRGATHRSAVVAARVPRRGGAALHARSGSRASSCARAGCAPRRRFFSYGSMWKRWAVPPRSSWIQRVGFWPLNMMQHRVTRAREARVAAVLGACLTSRAAPR